MDSVEVPVTDTTFTVSIATALYVRKSSARWTTGPYAIWLKITLYLVQTERNMYYVNMSEQHDQNKLNNEQFLCNTQHVYGSNNSKNGFELPTALHNRKEDITQSQDNERRAFKTTVQILAVNLRLLEKTREQSINEITKTKRRGGFIEGIFRIRSKIMETTIETLAVNLCLLEKKPGRNKSMGSQTQ